MALHLCLPSPACSSILGQPVGAKTVGPFGDELMTAALTQDTWRTRHDSVKVAMVKNANEARIPIDFEVFGLFRDLIPAQLMEEGVSWATVASAMGCVQTSSCDFKHQKGRVTAWAS